MKRGLAGSLIASVLGLLVVGPAHATSQFVRQVVEEPDTIGQVTSLSVDAQGIPHVAYWGPQRKDLKFAEKPAGSWVTESAESTDVLGLHASMALTAAGEPRIAYWNATRGQLELASRNAGAWSVEIVDNAGIVGEYASLKLGAADDPHISYRDSTNQHLKYAHRIAGNWTIETVDNGTNVGKFTSLALNSAGEPRIAYWDGAARNLKLASHNGGSWSIETVDAADSVGQYPSLVLVSDEPRITYFDEAHGIMKYAVHSGGGWTLESVPDPQFLTNTVGQFSSLSFDTYGEAVVGFFDATNADLRVATKRPAGWGSLAVDAIGNVGQFASFAMVDTLGQVAYYDATNGDLKYAFQTVGPPPAKPVWQLPITVDSKGDVGRFASLVLDANHTPRIAYWDRSREDLRYAAWNGTGFTFEVASEGGDTGQFPSLAMSAAGVPNISYFDALHGDLKYATKNGAAWQLEAVDTVGVVGSYTSLKLDAQGDPHVAYRDETNGDLKYATRSGGIWTTTVVDPAGDVGAYASLALDAQGEGRIAYWDGTNQHLKLATQTGLAWTTETVDPAFGAGQYASLALTSTGDPRISYYDATNGDLLYASKTGGAWTIQRVDTVGDVGRFTSLLLDSSDEPRISYYDATKKDLRFASHQDTSWVSDIVDQAGDQGQFTSLAVYQGSFDGSPRISYRMTYWDNTVGQLRYSVQAYPDLHLWTYPGAYHRSAGADTIQNRPRTLTLRWMRDPVMEGRPDFGGYRIYRVFNDPDTTRLELIRRFSVNSADSLIMWHFLPINENTPDAQRIATYIDPDSSGAFFKRCRRDTAGRCFSPGDSVIVLLTPPGPHDGFRTWFAITYEQRNQVSSDFADLFLNDAIACRNAERATCPNLNNKARNMTGPVTPTSGPAPNLLHVSVIPNPFRGGEAWDQTGSNEVHFINLPSKAKISIYTVAGDLVAVLNHSDTVHDYEPWNLKNGRGRDVASGIYIYRVEATSFFLQDRFVVIR